MERSGAKLENILHKSDPWQGQDCGQDKCTLCKTKQKTGKLTTQDCHRRSLVYESWCMTCLDRDQTNAGNNKNKLKKLQENIRIHKYIGEIRVSTRREKTRRSRHASHWTRRPERDAKKRAGKKERKTRKRMLEESWQVARRTTDYIDENLERWQSE